MMNFKPTIFMTQLLVAMQVLMTLDMPLSMTLALPVTSKPIESTVENLAWQAWIELPPEQKQQVKSRKVTPKSIFTLPLRVECPEGHKQVDTKCIPVVIGSNDVLIDLNALSLLVGNTQTDDMYDYDDVGEEMYGALPYASEMLVGEEQKSAGDLAVELKPPSKDEPLKFNIFQNKFNIFSEEPMEEYPALSNEGVLGSEKDQNKTVQDSQLKNETFIETANIKAINDLLSEASNISNNFGIYVNAEAHPLSFSSDSKTEQTNSSTTLPDEKDFKIEAISLPAFGYETNKSNKLQLVQNDSSIQLVTTTMDTETAIASEDASKQPEIDLETLLKTESFLPLVNHTKGYALQESSAAENSSATAEVFIQDPSENAAALSLQVDDEEATTLSNEMFEQKLPLQTKQEFTRSVTINPLTIADFDSNSDDNDDNGAVKDATLESVTYDEPTETTTPIQLDDTTVIETSSSLATTPSSSTQQELKELLLYQEQAQEDLEELRRLRKGQQNKLQQQHVVKKKSKVEPVEVVSTKTTTAAATATLTAPTKRVDDLITTTEAAAVVTVTPLLTAHNENDNKSNNNDRFYYQHIGKPDNQYTESSSQLKVMTAEPTAASTKATEMKTKRLTSEIDMAEELRLINELVKGIRTATTTTTTVKTTKTPNKTTTSTTEKSAMLSATTDEIPTSSTSSLASESSSKVRKPAPTTLEIWSKIMPLLSTTTTESSLTDTNKSPSVNSKEEPSNYSKTSELAAAATRSNRNSKIIRINGFNSRSIANPSPTSSSPTTTTTNTLNEEEFTNTETEITTSHGSVDTHAESSTENNTYEPYWWLPVAWRLDKPTNTEKERKEQETDTEEQPLLLRFWSAYRAPKSS